MERGRAFGPEDDKGPQLLLVRAKEGTLLAKYGASFSEKDLVSQARSHMLATRDGAFLVTASDRQLQVMDCARKPVFSRDFERILYAQLSPGQRYLQVLEKLSLEVAEVVLLAFPEGRELARFREEESGVFANAENWPLLKFSRDEAVIIQRCKAVLKCYHHVDPKDVKKNCKEVKVGFFDFF
jgi:hypothetical protein